MGVLSLLKMKETILAVAVLAFVCLSQAEELMGRSMGLPIG
jgi:hypothetical protein